MTFVQGFKTLEEAKAFVEERGGQICSKSQNKYDYKTSCQATGLNPNDWPYIIIKRNV